MPERYQEEIEEILKGIEETSPKQARSGGVDRGPGEAYRSVRYKEPGEAPSAAPRRPWWRSFLSSGKLALAGLLMFVFWLLLQWMVLIWIGLALLVVAYLIFFVKPRSPYGEKIWRGRSMEERRSHWESVKRWLKS
jgi:uncharacterized membrane protein YccC